MHKYITLFFAISLSYLSGAQIKQIYNKDTLKSYTGTWVWIKGKDTFTLLLKIDTLQNNNPASGTERGKKCIYAWHKYTEAGKVLENTLVYAGDIKKSSGVGIVQLSTNTISLGLAFTDYLRQRPLRIFFKIINIEGDKAVWESWLQERTIYPNPTPKYWDGRTIPSPLILQKLKN